MVEKHPRSSQRPRRVTAQAVADAAGVSRSAVSRTFTPGAYVDAEKRARIQAVAEEMGYQPNALAAGLKGGRSHLVAIFVGNMRSAYDTAFTSRLVAELNALDKWPLLIDGGDARAEEALEKVLRYPLDALILRGGSMPGAIVEQCAKYNIPMISSGRLLQAKGVDCVCCRNDEGTALATRALLESGRKRFAYIGGPPDFYSSEGRRDGVVRTLAQAGLSLVAETAGEFTVQSGDSAARALLASGGIDALVCANDATAIGALGAARDMGFHVPRTLAVTGFDDADMAAWPMFNLSTVRNPLGESVAAILDLLERRLQDPARSARTVYIDPDFVPRGTH